MSTCTPFRTDSFTNEARNSVPVARPLQEAERALLILSISAAARVCRANSLVLNCPSVEGCSALINGKRDDLPL